MTPHSGMSLQAPHPCQGRDCACRQARSQQAGAPPHPRPGQFLSVVLDSGPSQEDARQQTTLQGGPGLAPCPPLGHRAAWGWGAGSQEVQGQGCPAGVGAHVLPRPSSKPPAGGRLQGPGHPRAVPPLSDLGRAQCLALERRRVYPRPPGGQVGAEAADGTSAAPQARAPSFRRLGVGGNVVLVEKAP